MKAKIGAAGIAGAWVAVIAIRIYRAAIRDGIVLTYVAYANILGARIHIQAICVGRASRRDVVTAAIAQRSVWRFAFFGRTNNSIPAARAFRGANAAFRRSIANTVVIAYRRDQGAGRKRGACNPIRRITLFRRANNSVSAPFCEASGTAAITIVGIAVVTILAKL